MTPDSGHISLPYAAQSPRPRRLMRNLWENAGMLLVFFVLFIGAALFVPNFASLLNMKGLMLSVATVGIIACTMLFCLAAGDFDLSIGSVVAMAGVLVAVAINKTGSVTLGILAGLLAGAVVGLVNGVVIARIGINALITTLASMQIVRGLSYIISDGKAIGISQQSFFGLGNSSFPHVEASVPALLVDFHRTFPFVSWSLYRTQGDLGIPTPVWIMIACMAVFGLLLNRTTFGRNALAIGGNREAARLAGIPVTAIKIAIFTLQGLIAAFAGVILASRVTSGQPKIAEGLELQVISACVLGGVSLTGGVGTITGVMAGVFIMGTVQNAMNLWNVQPFYQYVANGAILLAAVLLDRLKQRPSG